MKRTISLLKLFAILVTIAMLPGIQGAAAQSGKVADVTYDSTGITWMPKISYSKLILNVAGPDGSVVTKTFEEGGTAPYFALSSLEGNLYDGSYTYELRVVPVNTVGRKSRGLEETSSLGALAAGEYKNQKPTVQTGYFRVKGGMIKTSNTVERLSRANDIVHNDDVIIDGSLCVGNDCYSGLAFGFDTIVLMENNLRIFFDDTSSIQNYPRNDWRIVCNDSTDGGGNYFAVQDATDVSNIMVLEAGAPSNSIYVDNHGDVGINTSTPYYELHIVDGDSPAVRLEQDTSYGWPSQKWDLCGNESNFFIRDATNASKLPFRIEPEAPSNSIFIKSDGKIGLGTGAPAFPLEIETTGENAAVVIERTSGAAGKFLATTSVVQIGSRTNHNVNIIVNNSTPAAIFETDGDMAIGRSSAAYELHLGSGARCNAGTWEDGSSREYKQDITELTTMEAMGALLDLKPVKFKYKTHAEEERIGFIAEDVPELVASNDRKAMSSMDVVAVLTKVVQQQQKSIKEQMKLMQEQKEAILELKRKIVELEKEK